ncbi:MAG: TOMM precursor leader peptide-binding protein [Rhodobacter sp.]|nr:TOMM precursor leader peptide-binding protein [Rhodobacter sp.]MCY4168345.1 TOMM precursor leader peptide-binding protein [Rhodobacter sp.]MCY4241403.1 TOMM precursor leader peptide-binding protein [Rhodobacter sp.]
MDDRQVFLVSETANTLLHGTIYPDLLPLLDGRRTYAEIVSGIEAGHREPSIRKALVALVSKGYVVSGEHGLKNGVAAFWTSLGASPRFAEERLAASRVAVYGDTGGFAQRLASLNAALTDDASAATLSVIVCDDYLDERHAETNRRHIASGKPWMLVRSIGMQPLFGPVFRPGEHGPCWACLTYRLSGNQEIHNFLRNATDGDISLVPKAAAPASLDVVLGLAATELVKWLVLGKAAPIHEQAVSFDNFEFSLARHTVMRRPQCSVCGDESLYRSDRQLVPVRLTSSPKSLRNSGGVRSVTPESTLARYRNLVDPIAGVVTWLRRMTSDSDPWLNVHWAGSNLALKNRALNVLRLSLRTKSAGKGSTPSQSEASALCEALERYCGAYHGDEIRFRRRYIDFSVDGGSEAIHPNSVQLFSEAQLDDADRINASGHPYNVVPPRLDPDAEMDWSPVWSLTGDCPRYLPTSLLYYGKSTDNRGVKDFVADSNGCAAGNTLEEAILQGFFELVERDAFAVWWYNQLRMPEVDLESFDDAYLAKARDYYRGLNRDLWVLDVTGDFGIPAFVALSRRTDGKAEDIVYGAGAHMDPHIGVLRAVCELNQFLNWVQGTGPGGAGYQVDDPQCLTWWRNATIENQPYLVPATDMLARRGSSYPPPPTAERDDLREDLERCIALVEAKGMEFLVLDQTRPDIGMPVARVIVPGMRHYWARLAPGRLFDVPVEMGWRECRISEAEINMAPVIG